MTEANLENDLKSIVGDRVTTSEFERWFYTRDLIQVPGVIRALFNIMPAAVVKPETAEQISKIVTYCYRKGMPLTPRGAGSSGLFGAVPKRDGILLDMTGLAQIGEIDRARSVVTAEAGVVWWQLEQKLNKSGLSLMSYPSSAKSATLGGWVMTSGLGIGSLKYGSVYDHIISAEVVLPDGRIKEYSNHDELTTFFGTEGMLGIITKLTLKVRPQPESASYYLIYFEDIDNLFKCTYALAKSAHRPYSIEISDHKYISLLKASGYSVPDFGPRSGLLLAAFEGDKKEVSEGAAHLDELIRLHSGVSRENADHEWQQRFNVLRVRRAVPYLVPSGVVIPLEHLEAFYSRSERLKKRTIGTVGYIVSPNECYLMPMIVTDDKKTIGYTLSLHTPRELSNIAVVLGGKPGGGIGVWNAPYKAALLGKENAARLKKAKTELDPKNIMNPGMLFEPPLFFKQLPYQIAMTAANLLDKVIPSGGGNLPKEALEQEISACVQCGYCMNSCPTKQLWLSSTPRGRILMAKELSLYSPDKNRQIPEEYIARLYQCSLCGRCRVDCSVDIKSPEIWFDLRSRLADAGYRAKGLEGLTKSVDDVHNIVAKPNERRHDWINRVKLSQTVDFKRKAEVVYFVGCLSSFYPMTQIVARAFSQLLDIAGVDFTVVGGDEWCCGFPLLSAGQHEAAAKCINHNIERVKEAGAKSVVMTCPGCYRVWRDEYKEIIGQRHTFDVFHSTEFLARLIEQRKLDLKGLNDGVTYHDPCDLGRNSGIFDEPRYVMGKIPGLSLVELEENRKYCSCCGSGGDLLASNENIALDISRRKLGEVADTGMQTVVTACPACIRAMNIAKTATRAQVDILDITQLVLKATGREGARM